MATTFKTFLNNDVTQTRTMLYESIPITGSILTASYGLFPNENNIKNYPHGIFQSVYDYPYLSSSSNHIFDITVGYANSSAMSSSTAIQNEKKINMYNQMAMQLAGFDHTGSIQLFDQDGDILAGGTKLRECYFMAFSRLLVKDEIKKGSFSMVLGKTQAYGAANNTFVTITDAGAQNDFKVNSPAGEYGILSCSSGQGAGSTSGLVGLIYYQAGVVVLTASIFSVQPVGLLAANAYMTGATTTVEQVFTTYEVSGCADVLRHRIYSIDFNNTTELNSTIYFARMNHNEFNYSSNPTYLSASRINVKNSSLDQPVAYATTIGLYSADNELLACAKLSEPLKKDPSTELTIRVRLDY